ncbi:MAG: 2-oxo acid dehydrogenase [Kofleriaceae bacterium]|nr:2-oxo acid dehydrogenase [Kofleriaceae bacterium]
MPELNVALFRNRLRRRATIDVFFIAAVRQGSDLSGIKIADIVSKPVTEVADELTRRITELRGGRDRQFARTKRLTDGLPSPLLRGALRLAATITNELGLDLPALGLPREPFGSAMVSSVGSLGLPQGFAPLAWMYGVPLLVLVGEISRKPVVVGDHVEVGEILPITATIDHRYADGSHISRMMTAFREYLAVPARFEP